VTNERLENVVEAEYIYKRLWQENLKRIRMGKISIYDTLVDPNPLVSTDGKSIAYQTFV
tara:strand:- start:964 stop:1140 length:177 start_codon:yes stop_codon:yes gene_type:complete